MIIPKKQSIDYVFDLIFYKIGQNKIFSSIVNCLYRNNNLSYVKIQLYI